MPRYVVGGPCCCENTICPCAYYKMEESALSDFMDSTFNNYILTAAATHPSISGVIESGRAFTGSSFPSRSNAEDCFALQDTGGTMMGWFYYETTFSDSDWADLADPISPPGTDQWNITVDLPTDGASSNSVTFGIETDAGNEDVTVTLVLSLNTWYFFAAWVNRATQEIGIRVNNKTSVASYTGTPVSNDNSSKLRIALNAGGGDRNADEHAFYKRVVPSGELDTLYNNGNGARPKPSFCVEDDEAGRTELCTGCSGVAPEQISLVLAGITDGTCTSCSNYDGTYILTLTSISAGVCTWTYDGNAQAAGCTEIPSDVGDIELQISTIGQITVTLQTEGNFGPSNGTELTWVNPTGFQECDNFNAKSIAWSFSTPGGALDGCVGGASSTVTITSVN